MLIFPYFYYIFAFQHLVTQLFLGFAGDNFLEMVEKGKKLFEFQFLGSIPRKR